LQALKAKPLTWCCGGCLDKLKKKNERENVLHPLVHPHST
jgi:hypothetical protein